jgi:hypothetical protein
MARLANGDSECVQNQFGSQPAPGVVGGESFQNLLVTAAAFLDVARHERRPAPVLERAIVDLNEKGRDKLVAAGSIDQLVKLDVGDLEGHCKIMRVEAVFASDQERLSR